MLIRDEHHKLPVVIARPSIGKLMVVGGAKSGASVVTG